VQRYSTNEDVIKAWYWVKSGDGRNTNESIYFRGDTIFSYGEHFPMAHRLSSGTFMVNGDTYSSTTSHHQSILRRVLRNENTFIIPFSALTEAQVDFTKVVPIGTEGEKEIPYTYKDRVTGEKREGIRHLMGSTLFKYISPVKEFCSKEESEGYEVDTIKLQEMCSKDGTVNWELYRKLKYSEDCPVRYFRHQTKTDYYLSGMDETSVKPESSFFLSKLVKECSSVEEAYESMKPPEVIEYQKNLYCTDAAITLSEELGEELSVKRQGEFFFIPEQSPVVTDVLNKREKAKLLVKDAVLFHKDTRKVAQHTAAKGIVIDNITYVKGAIKHARKEHRVLRLKYWHRVYENVEDGTWKAGGNVD